MICPSCECRVEGEIGSRECPECGAFEKKNQNDNIIWMKDGQILQCLVEEDFAMEESNKQREATQRALDYLNKNSGK